MMMLLKAWLKVFLFSPFICFEDLYGVLEMLKLAVSVHNMDVNDAVHCMGPEAIS
jgi:hypothetical protein